MAIKARLLKSSEIPERVSLYEVRESRTVVVEEAHSDDSLDQASQYEAIPDLRGFPGIFTSTRRLLSVE